MLRELKKLIKKWRAGKNTQFQTAYINEPGMGNSVASYTTYTNTTPVGVGTLNNLSQDDYQKLATSKTPEDIRIEKKPVEVVNEIIAQKPVMTLNDLDVQIKIVKTRLKVLKQYKGQTYDEEMAIKYLEARKQYKKYEKMFPWAITTNELIGALISKYKLADRGFGGYSKSVPIEATNELEKFGKAWEKVVDDPAWEPTLKLITDYKGPETKKDPILLASSPFGRWWYVLGAWDKEVEIVDQIIYHGK